MLFKDTTQQKKLRVLQIGHCDHSDDLSFAVGLQLVLILRSRGFKNFCSLNEHRIIVLSTDESDQTLAKSPSYRFWILFCFRSPSSSDRDGFASSVRARVSTDCETLFVGTKKKSNTKGNATSLHDRHRFASSHGKLLRLRFVRFISKAVASSTDIRNISSLTSVLGSRESRAPHVIWRESALLNINGRCYDGRHLLYDVIQLHSNPSNWHLESRHLPNSCRLSDVLRNFCYRKLSRNLA